MIQIFAHSEVGIGEPAYVEIWTPEILPCGSDKDPGKILSAESVSKADGL